MTAITLTKPAPPAITNFSISAAVGSAALTWDQVALLGVKYEVWWSDSATRSTAVLLITTSTNSFTQHNLNSGQVKYFWVRAVSASGAYGPFTKSTTPTDYTRGSNFKTLKLYVYVANNGIGTATVSLDYVKASVYWRDSVTGSLGSATSLTFSTTVTQLSNGTYTWTNPANARADDTTYATVATGSLQSNMLVFTCSDLSSIADTAIIYEVALESRAQTTLTGKQLRAQLGTNATTGLFPSYAYLNLQGTTAFVGAWEPWIDPNSKDASVQATGSVDTSPSTASTDTVTGLSWLNPTYIDVAGDGQAATVVAPYGNGTTASYYPSLTATFPSFSVPSGATVKGVTIALYGSQSAPPNYAAQGSLSFETVQLLNSGVVLGTAKSSVGTALKGQTFGSASDTWAATLTPSIFNAGTFGVKVRLVGDIDGIRRQGNIEGAHAYITYANFDTNFPWFPPEPQDGTQVTATGAVTVATLTAAATAGAGARAFVTDATAATFASTVAGGGSNKVPVYCDGTNWLIG